MAKRHVNAVIGVATVLAVTLALVGRANAGANTSAALPAILSITASPGKTPATGKSVVIKVRVRNASTCTFFSQHEPFSTLYRVRTVACVSGYARAVMPAVGNPYHSAAYIRYMVRAHGAGGAVQRRVAVIESAEPTSKPPAPAPTPAPALQVLSVSASPNTVPISGGAVVVTVRTTDAASCTFSGADITTLQVNCGGESGGMTITYPANTGPTVTRSYSVTATGADGTTTSPTGFTVTLQGAPVPPSLQNYLDICTPGVDCYYGPFSASYPDYGNVAPANLEDCTFAAAAHWEQIVFGITPDPTAIGYEFAAAGGSATGLPMNSLWAYWQQEGIGGVRLTGLNSYLPNQANVENGVRDYGAMIVSFQFVDGDAFAQYTVSAGLHAAVVDGFTPEGPLIVTWGQTLQMTWAQWNAEVTGMWGIGTH